jgi:hypothetical protein
VLPIPVDEIRPLYDCPNLINLTGELFVPFPNVVET